MIAKKATDLEDIAGAIQDLATHIDRRFEQVDQRLIGVESELSAIRREQAEVRQWLERIDSRLQGVESDIKEIYDRISALEAKGSHLTLQEKMELQSQLTALFKWAKEVSKQTGIPLPKL